MTSCSLLSAHIAICQSRCQNQMTTQQGLQGLMIQNIPPRKGIRSRLISYSKWVNSDKRRCSRKRCVRLSSSKGHIKILLHTHTLTRTHTITHTDTHDASHNATQVRQLREKLVDTERLLERARDEAITAQVCGHCERSNIPKTQFICILNICMVCSCTKRQGPREA